MSTTLTNGLKLPDKGSVDWYANMQNNYTILDGAVGTIAEHTSALAGKAPLVHTHGKADITDLFNSANTWTGEQTFSQTIQGNAATASAFDTAKSITLTGAVTGTASGTNSWEIATVLKTGTAFTGGTVPAPYFKIASWKVAPNTYFGAILQIQNKCYPQNTATLTISVRTKTDATFQRGYSFLNNAIGCLPSEFILCYKEVTGKVLCELYFYTTTSYNGIRFSVISEGIQNDSSLFNTMVVYQSPAGIAALPSDYTVIQTTIGTYTQDFIPYSNNTYDLGSSSYQWNNLYAKNYYYNGTAWGLDKANTWTGRNQFNNLSLYSNDVTYNQAPSSNIELPSIRIMGGGRYCGAFDYVWRSTGENVIRLSLGSFTSAGSFGYWACNFGIPRDFSDGGKFGTPAFYPNTSGGYDLGTSTNKWKSLNGINPGALSLPNSSAAIQLDTTGWDLTGATNISYTSSFDGWLELRCQDVAGDYLFATCNEYRQSVTGSGSITAASAGLALTIPVRANVSISIIVKASNKFRAYLTPCLGNV